MCSVCSVVGFLASNWGQSLGFVKRFPQFSTIDSVRGLWPCPRLAPRRLTRLPANERQPLGAIDCTPAAILYTDQSMIHPAAGEVETFVE